MQFEFEIYGEDLANLEDEMKLREEEKAKLDALPWPLRKLKQSKIVHLEKEIGRLGYKISAAWEHVQVDPVKADSHRKIRKARDWEKKAEAEREAEKGEAKVSLVQQAEAQQQKKAEKQEQRQQEAQVAQVKSADAKKEQQRAAEVSKEEIKKAAATKEKIDAAMAFLEKRNRERQEQALKDPYMAPEKRQKILENEYEPE